MTAALTQESSPAALLRRDCLTLDALPHWATSPWFPEHWNQMILPLYVGGRTIYFATSGLILFLPQTDPGKVTIEGRTGEYTSTLHIERVGGGYDLRGTLNSADVGVRVELSPGRIEVRGPAGTYRSDFNIERTEQGWTLQGSTGQYFSNFQMIEEEGLIRMLGSRRNQALDSKLYWEGNGLHWRDVGGRNLVVECMDANTALLEGQFQQDHSKLLFTATPNELRVQGAIPAGKVNLHITDEGSRLVVKGRLQKWFVNYTVEAT